MKRILLALMMMVSVSFASQCLDYVTYNGNVYKLQSCTPLIGGTTSKLFDSEFSVSWYSGVHQNFTTSTGFNCSINISGVRSCYYYNSEVYAGFYGTAPQNDCQSPKTIVNGECVAPEPETCDPIGAQYTSTTTGKCVDCMPFQAFSQRASCACDSQGSSYTPQATTQYEYTSGMGGYTYKKTNVTCDNGQRVAVYYDPVSNTPTDNNTTTPTDGNNTTPPKDTNTTTPTDGNTTPTTTPTQADLVKALQQIQDGQKDATTALKDIGVDAKAMKEQMVKDGLTFSDILKSINAGNDKADKMYQLTDDMYKGQTQIKNTLGKWVDSYEKGSAAQLGATQDVTKAVNGTTGAVNAQGDKITGKLDDILNAIKDGNGTDMTATNEKLDTLHTDNNRTWQKLDTIANYESNISGFLDQLVGNFDNNDSYKVPDVNDTKFELSDLLPEESWFENNKLQLNFNNYGGDCYCQTAEFTVAGKTFVFPPQEALDVIPFTTISNIFMAFIFILGAKDFLRD